MCLQCIPYAARGHASIARRMFHPPFTRAVRQQVYTTAGGACVYCKEWDFIGFGEVDHILPTSKGGTDNWENLAWSCHRCNRSKGTKAAPDLERRYIPAGDLRWELEIVWLRDRATMPYVREQLATMQGRKAKPKWSGMVAYAVLKPNAVPENAGYGTFFHRRLWVLQNNDFYGEGWPCEGVATSSVIAGQETRAGRDF